MRRGAAVLVVLALPACAAPAIDDWPPEAPPVADATVQRYVDLYARDQPAPRYGADEIEALTLLLNRRAETGDRPDLERFQADLEALRARRARDRDDVTEPAPRSRGEIDAIERRVERRYESRHDRRHVLKGRYGL